MGEERRTPPLRGFDRRLLHLINTGLTVTDFQGQPDVQLEKTNDAVAMGTTTRP